jgi:hypothetical protein
MLPLSSMKSDLFLESIRIGYFGWNILLVNFKAIWSWNVLVKFVIKKIFFFNTFMLV